MARSELMAQVREYIRHPHAFPGGYPKILIMHDGEALCPKCAKAEYRQISNETRHSLRQGGWCAAGVDLHLEGQDVQCAHCETMIESAYGDPARENSLDAELREAFDNLVDETREFEEWVFDIAGDATSPLQQKALEHQLRAERGH